MQLVIAEQREGTVNRVTWEVIAAAQQSNYPVHVAVIGARAKEAARELAKADVEEILVLDHETVYSYTADGYVNALVQLINKENPCLVLFAHTYQTRDFAPKLAARIDRTLITDCVGTKFHKDDKVFVRPIFQGKLLIDVAPEGPEPYLVSFQVGTYRVEDVGMGSGLAPIRLIPVDLDEGEIRQRAEKPFKAAKKAVDLTQADRIVAVGRGIKDAENILIVQELARVLGAELAASRPVCDSGWLPMDRQIGSSGQTVSPNLYLAIGISGAIQHLVGIRGSKTIVAINKDADAPIFEVADYGIVGDLFEIVPRLLSALGE